MDNAKPQEIDKENQTVTPELELVNKWAKKFEDSTTFYTKAFGRIFGN